MLGRELPTWPEYSEEEVDAVSQLLRSGKVNYWTGNEIRQFEQEFATFVGSEFALAVSNGTLALELTLRAFDIVPNDEVIVAPRSFIASASAVINAGATPVFADVDLDTQALSAETISAVISEKTKAVIVVHVGGMPADMGPIMSLSQTHGFKVIEDCAQAHGAKYKGQNVGSIGHAAAWSFCQEKIISTGGEGGMVTSSDEDFISKCWSYRDHGKSQQAITDNGNTPPGEYRWVHTSIGSNFRMLEFQAAIGRIQLGKLNKWLEVRKRNADLIFAGVGSLPGVSTFTQGLHSKPVFYKAYLRIEALGSMSALQRRNGIIAQLQRRGIDCGVGACPELYREEAFTRYFGKELGALPNAQMLGDETLILNVHPTLTVDDMKFITQSLKESVLAFSECSAIS